MKNDKSLLAITELGGYPDFTTLYNECGFKVELATSMRKALRSLKQGKFDVIVAEFNFQTDFRDRTSNLETLMAVIQQMDDVKVIIFYEKEYLHHFENYEHGFHFMQSLHIQLKNKI